VLSTQQQGQPYASLVAFVACDDLRHIYFVTPKTTRKFANLTANPSAAFIVNNSIKENGI
jgi:nitroimidazol reductase NimA-like FMN-containing flavoprotein (pyridoxamine 5'-phosphate oxidase superfamily)